jgi:hypothetical protein
MPAKLNIPEPFIVSRWVSNISVTTRTLAEEYGCSSPCISDVLHRHLTDENIKTIMKCKLSFSTSNRMDLKSEEHRKKAQHAASCVTLEGRVRSAQALIVGSKVSAANRRGIPLSKSHIEKLVEAHQGVMPSGDKHPNWKGGTSKICSRGLGWKKARRLALERDEDTCQLCGKTYESQHRHMDVHHIKSWFLFNNPQEANDISNLICLCRSCHRIVENEIDKRNRKTQDKFVCLSCGHAENADLNAARNIAGRAYVITPIVEPLFGSTSPDISLGK